MLLPFVIPECSNRGSKKHRFPPRTCGNDNGGPNSDSLTL